MRALLLILLVGIPVTAQVFLPARRIVPFLSLETIPPPLDIVTNPPWSAWSVSRKLWSGWTGNAYQVRRLGDATTSEIGFDANGQVDTNALMVFAGTTNSFTKIIYDQSGNGKHLNVLPGNTNVMQVATNGVVVVDQRGRPTGWMYGLSNNWSLAASVDPVALSNTFFTVVTPLIEPLDNSGSYAGDNLINSGGAHQCGINLQGPRFEVVNENIIYAGITSAPVVLGKQYQVTALFRSNNTEVVQVNFDAANNTTVGAAGEHHSSTPTIGWNASSLSAQQFWSEWILYNQQADTNTWAEMSQNMIDYYDISYPTVAVTNATYFGTAQDGTLLTSSGPTGLADGKLFTASAWVNLAPSSDGQECTIFTMGNPSSPGFNLRRSTNHRIQCYGFNAAAAIIMNFGTATNTLSYTNRNWVHILVAFDNSDTNTYRIFINGTSMPVEVFNYSNDTLDVVGSSYRYTAGSYNSTPLSANWNGGISELWVDDLYATNVAAFYNSGQPVNLGSDGSTPTGSQPVFYFRDVGQNFGINSGTGGNFSSTFPSALGCMWPPGVTP